MKKIIVFAVLFLALAFVVSATDYGLTSVSGVWTSVSGGSGITGINTNQVRWGTPADIYKSGLIFNGTGTQNFNEGDKFLLGTLTHSNWAIISGTGADSAKLKINLAFATPAVTPNPEFTFDFNIEETPNTKGQCPSWQVSNVPCDDRVTFPQNYGEESYQIGDKLYTVKILGFVDSYPSGNPVSAFITQEEKDNSAYLVGTLSSVLIEAPQITLVSKTTNGQYTDTAPGITLYVGDPITWEYLVQNTGNVALTNVTVSDDKETVTCPKGTLAAGEAMTCSASGVAALGQYENTAQATAKHGSDTLTSEEKQGHYLGINPVQETPQITLVSKKTNNEAAETAPGPSILVGDPVEWDYLMQNTGNVPLTNIFVMDDQNLTVVCPQSSLQPAESMTCSASGTAVLGQYTNTAFVVAQHGSDTLYSNEKTSHYLGYKDNPQVPEFGIVAGTIALLGAVGIFMFRKKN